MSDSTNRNESDSDSRSFVRVEVLENLSDTDQNKKDGAVTGSTIRRDIEIEEHEGKYANIMIPTHEWKNRIQDVGCSKAELKVKRYKGSNISPYGPKEAPIYYFHLTSIAIDYLKCFKKEKDLGRGWAKVPKNPTDIKTKIVERFLSMRKFSEQSKKYELDQNRLLDMLTNVWGQAQPKNVIHFNDRLRLFGILMSIPSNRPLFERLASGVADKNVLDDIGMQPKNIFQKLTFDFCNDSIQVQLPPNSIDVEGWECLDPNDASRIRIH